MQQGESDEWKNLHSFLFNRQTANDTSGKEENETTR